MLEINVTYLYCFVATSRYLLKSAKPIFVLSLRSLNEVLLQLQLNWNHPVYYNTYMSVNHR